MATILYVEDDVDARQAFMTFLERRGYGVVTASSGEEALEILQAWTPELVVTDLLLGGIDGGEFCRVLRRRPETMSVPIILITGVAARMGLSLSPRDKDWAPANEILDKKIGPDKLLDVIERLLEMAEDGPTESD